MDERLRQHQPSAAARRRAESAGIDLDLLKRERPDEYRMLNATEAFRIAPRLVEEVAAALALAYPEHAFFRAPAGALDRLLAFPPLAGRELGALGELLADLARGPAWRARHVVVREVDDRQGRRREVLLPTAPRDFAGGEAWVGPFASRAEADAWGRASLQPPYVHDVLPRDGAWYCDVFSGEGSPPPADR